MLRALLASESPLVALQAVGARDPHSDAPYDFRSFACSAGWLIELLLMAEISACADPQFLSFTNAVVRRDASLRKNTLNHALINIRRDRALA